MESRISRIERAVDHLILSLQDSIKEINEIQKDLTELQNGNFDLEEGLKKELAQVYGDLSQSNNELRAIKIKDAKDFVAEYIEGDGDLVNYGFIRYIIDFKVNKNKRTVEALLIGRTTNFVHKRVKVTCHPDDVFNVDLGKAIAVGRLLELDVSEFEDAVQPDTVVVDMVVKSTNLGNIHKVEGFYSYEMLDGEYGKSFYAYGFTKPQWIGEKQVVILDDTDAKYEFN